MTYSHYKGEKWVWAREQAVKADNCPLGRCQNRLVRLALYVRIKYPRCSYSTGSVTGVKPETRPLERLGGMLATCRSGAISVMAVFSAECADS